MTTTDLEDPDATPDDAELRRLTAAAATIFGSTLPTPRPGTLSSFLVLPFIQSK